MKKLIFLVSIFAMFSSCLIAQNQNGGFGNLEFLIGNWKGEGTGKPGEGEGTFSFKPDLQNNVLIRTAHSEYPAVDKNPAVIHDDLMIIYRNAEGIPGKAIYFDNENHVINYTISSPDKDNIIFVSSKTDENPSFRLTYQFTGSDTVNVKFEYSPDGRKYLTYVEGRSVRMK